MSSCTKWPSHSQSLWASLSICLTPMFNNTKQNCLTLSIIAINLSTLSNNSVRLWKGNSGQVYTVHFFLFVILRRRLPFYCWLPQLRILDHLKWLNYNNYIKNVFDFSFKLRWWITLLLNVQNENQEVVRPRTLIALQRTLDVFQAQGAQEAIQEDWEEEQWKKIFWEADLNKQPKETLNDHKLSQVWMSSHKEVNSNEQTKVGRNHFQNYYFFTMCVLSLTWVSTEP